MLEGWIRTDRPARRIPEADLLAGVCKLVTGRIAYWQAEVLSPEVNSKGTRRAVGERLLARAKAQYPMKDIESRIGVSRSTFYKWIENPDSVLDVTADKIIADLHKLVDSTSSE